MLVPVPSGVSAGQGDGAEPGSEALAARVAAGPGLWDDEGWLAELRRDGLIGEPLAAGGTAFGLELVIFDGTTLDLFNCPELAAEFGVPEGGRHPKLRLVALLQAGTMRWKAAAIGGYHDGENALADQLEDALGPGQLSLADRGFFSMDRWLRFSAAGAHLLWRVKNAARSVPFRPPRTPQDRSEAVLLPESGNMRG